MSFQYDVTASEIAEIEAILAALPQDEVITRISFESRLRSAKAALAAMPHGRCVKRAKLTFRGEPVIGSHGMAADFGSKAAGAFADAFAAVAAGLSENLHYMGPLPDRVRNRLLITGTTIGSFGFEFELPPDPDDLFPDAGRTQEAFRKLQDLLRISAAGTDDEIAELVEQIHPRAVRKVADFLEFLMQKQALCALEFDDQLFRYGSSEQLGLSVARLQEENIHERDAEFEGSFAGVLPDSRTFEFNLFNDNGLIKGKLAIEIADPDLLNREWLRLPAKIKLGVIQVGQGRPRFTLKSLDSVSRL